VTICKFGGEEEGMPRVGIILEGVRTVDRNRKKKGGFYTGGKFFVAFNM
jgi:hypothetical protein